MMRKRAKTPSAPNDAVSSVSLSPSSNMVFLLHLACGLGLASAFWAANGFYSLNLVDHPDQFLPLLWGVEGVVVILLYSLFRHNPYQCAYVKAIFRGLVALPAGAILNAVGAIVLGAPVGIKHLQKTVHWSLMMSVFTLVPAASVFGSSWTDWHRLFAQTKPAGPIDFMVCLPAHGAVIGAWFGAWPMPLDWERPWQEWPICVTYGAIVGYLVGMVASIGFAVFHNRRQQVKRD